MATVKLDPAKGVQIPNMTTTERNAVSSPETGALVWNTTTSAVNQYNGSAWKEMLRSDGSAASLTAIPAANITGTLPAISGANLTGVGVDGIVSTANATAITIDSSESVGIDNSTGFGNYSGTGVKYAKGDGTLFIGRDGGVPLLINRETDQGDMIAFNVAGSSKVKIGTVSDGLFLGTGTGGNTKALTITSDRNVGIGDTTPIAKVHIAKGGTSSVTDTDDTLLLSDADGVSLTLENTNTSSGNRNLRIRNNAGELYFERMNDAASSVTSTPMTVAFVDNVVKFAGAIALGGTGTANQMDDYEEGTWTATVSQGSISSQNCSYTKIGRSINLRGYVVYGGSSSNAASMGGIAFTQGSKGVSGSCFPAMLSVSTDGMVMVKMNPNNSTLYVYSFRESSIESAYQNEGELMFDITYET